MAVALAAPNYSNRVIEPAREVATSLTLFFFLYFFPLFFLSSLPYASFLLRSFQFLSARFPLNMPLGLNNGYGISAI